MVIFKENTHRTTASSLGGLAHSLVAEFKAAMARQAAFRRTHDELSKLSDRELNDIGIDRSMIAECAEIEANRT